MPPPHQPHQQQLQSQQHHPSRPRGPPPFQGHGRPLTQQPLQPLIPPHMAHRSPPLRPQLEPPPRMMSSPPPNFPQHHQQQPPQPKNIHINPHFRGPTSSSVQGGLIHSHSSAYYITLKFTSMLVQKNYVISSVFWIHSAAQLTVVVLFSSAMYASSKRYIASHQTLLIICTSHLHKWQDAWSTVQRQKNIPLKIVPVQGKGAYLSIV